MLFLPPSDAYVRSFLYLLYALIKLYTKALSNQALSLAPDWILLLREPRILAYSRDSTTTFHLLTLSWRIPDEPPRWKVVVESRYTPGFLAPGGEEFNPGPETRLDRSELLCNEVLLKYRDRESFWHRHQKGVERVPKRLIQKMFNKKIHYPYRLLTYNSS